MDIAVVVDIAYNVEYNQIMKIRIIWLKWKPKTPVTTTASR